MKEPEPREFVHWRTNREIRKSHGRRRALGLLAMAVVLLAPACQPSSVLGAALSAATPLAPTPDPPTHSANVPSAATIDPTATSPEPAASPTAGPSLEPQVTPGPAIDPLTGLAVDDPSLLARRPVAIKVSNYPRSARPQAGLSFADLLFEFYQEHGETRFQAIFLSHDVKKVGPIRSGRIVDAKLEKMYQSILVFNGADSRVWDRLALEDVRQFSLYEGPAPCPALCRDSSQAHINSLYGNTAELRKAAVAVNIPEIVPDLNGMAFDPAPPAGGQPAGDLLVRFLTDDARAEWRYDPSSGKYLRWSETSKGTMAPLTDRLTGEQLSVSNLVVVFVQFIQRQSVEMYDVILDGGGRALFFRDGQEWAGYWRVTNPSRPLQFFGDQGPFALHPGVTWIALVGANSTFANNGDAWRVEFGLP